MRPSKPRFEPKPSEVMFRTPRTTPLYQLREDLRMIEEQPLDDHAYLFDWGKGERRYLKYDGKPLEVRHALCLLRGWV